MLDFNLIGSGEEHSQFSNGDYTGGNGTTKPGVTLDAGRWYCMEGFWNGKDHQFQLWVDDVEVTGAACHRLGQANDELVADVQHSERSERRSSAVIQGSSGTTTSPSG